MFKYLGCLLVQDDNDVQVLPQQICKLGGYGRASARCWYMVRGENATPCIAAKFYIAVVQSGLLYGSKTWNLMFHIPTDYRMARPHKPCRDLFG